jgi:gliding motility-associated-like protein
LPNYFGPTANIQIEAGLHVISLVARNGTCSDTTTVVYFSAGRPYDVDSSMLAYYGFHRANDYGTSITGTLDGGFMLGGYSTLPGCGEKGLIIKLRDKGCIDWTKSLKGPANCDYIKVNSVFASQDSGYYITSSRGPQFITKLDKYGRLQWMRQWSIATSSYYLGITRITEDPAGNLYVTAQSFDYGMQVTKMDPLGNVNWSKYYHSSYHNPVTGVNTFFVPTGVVWINNKVYVSGTVYSHINGEDFNFLLQLDDVTGQTGWQYGYSDGTGSTSMNFTHAVKMGNQILTAGANAGQWATLIDQQGNVRKSIRANFFTSFAPKETKIAVDGNDNIYLMQWTEQPLPLQPYYAYHSNFIKIDTSLTKKWGMVYTTSPRGYFTDIAVNNKNSFAGIGHDFGKVTDALAGSRDIRLLKLDGAWSINDLSCDYSTLDYTLNLQQIYRRDFQWKTDSFLTIIPQDITQYTIKDEYIESRYSCPDFIDSCSFMKLSGPIELCNFDDTYTYRIHKNKKCVLLPRWELSPGISIISQTDSTVEFKFASAGQFKIAAQLSSCIPVKDSLTINIGLKYQLSLGRDTMICNNTPITLHAGKSFLSYSWTDGSTDSTLTVTQPGIYWVEVIDSCGNRLRDSIQINNFNYPISIGPDRIKCNNDTIRLSAPDGFLNYRWSNNYNISSTTTQQVVVNPLVDTVYYLRAEKLPGCFSFDTVRIESNQSPLIRLGNDTSFCTGNSATFDAGTGFAQYQWNTGANLQQINVNNLGKYSVVGTTAEGCKSYDTINVIAVWLLPVVAIKGDSTLCLGGTRLLDAGTFTGNAQYLWNDGSNTQTIRIDQLNVFTVQVTDEKGCINNDDFTVNKIVPNPEKFLPSDTAICAYGKLDLLPAGEYNSYLWNTNANTRLLTISKPGEYSLQVVDQNKCTGKDTINVVQKDCLRGLFVPTGFTPNGDGKNDVFRAMLYGNVRSFEFSIFNRWGQLVFRTNDPYKGWDGKVGGTSQSTGGFTWVCKYQLEDDPVRIERGAVVLIR